MAWSGPAWLPSADRTIPLFDFRHPAPRGRVAACAPRAWPAKSRSSVLDYTLDCAGLVEATSDGISSVTIDPGGLSVVQVALLSSALILWLGGGAPGAASIGLGIGTTLGQAVSVSVAMTILADAGPPLPVQSPLLVNGQPLIVNNPGTLQVEGGGPLQTESGLALLSPGQEPLTPAIAHYLSAAATSAGAVLLRPDAADPLRFVA